MDKPYRSWPLLVLAAPASVAVWSGWVGLGTMTGFGSVRPLPGILDGFTINTAITLPIGVEAYGAYALGAWLSRRRLAEGTRRFACVSAVGALLLGMLGQVAFHLLEVAHKAKVAEIAGKTGQTVEKVEKAMPAQAPWLIVTVVACFPVLVLGMGATLAHLIHRDARGEGTVAPPDGGEVREEVADGDPLGDEAEPVPAVPEGRTWVDGQRLPFVPLTFEPSAEPATNGHAVPAPTKAPDGVPEYVPEEWTAVPGDGYSTWDSVPESESAPWEDSPAPGPSPQAGGVPGGVPEGVPEPDGHQVQAASVFAADIDAGEVPSIRKIRKTLKVGQDRATQVQAYLTVLVEQQPVPARGGYGVPEGVNEQ